MQRISGLVRRCAEDYHMIAPGDKIAVGLSGGKDSTILLCALAHLKRYSNIPFTLEAITLDLGIPGMDFSPLDALCRSLDVPYTRIETKLYDVIFLQRKEKNPCSLCAKLRRGALATALLERGLHKIALGHHYDDAVETFLMALFFEGRVHSFAPVTYLSRTGVTQIRPLLYTGESLIRSTARRLDLPVIPNPCPANGHTKRQEIKDLLASMEIQSPGVKSRIFGAMQRLPISGWEAEHLGRRPLPNDPDED